MLFETEQSWLSSHPKEMERFSGKWVAVLNESVVATGNSYEEVWKDIKLKHPGKYPIITYVLKPGEEQLIA